MLSIGEFSRLCFVSRKTLRHYDEIGLLRPEHVAENGYRYYGVAQLRDMLLIARLKSYGFALPEIAAVLAAPDEDALADRLLEKRLRLEAALQDTARVLDQLDQDVDKLRRRIDIMDQNYLINTVDKEPIQLYSMRKRIDVKDFTELFGQLFMNITQRKLHPTGPPMVFYHEDDFKPEDCDVEIGIPVTETGEGVRIWPGGLCCYTSILGPYGSERYTPAYAALAKWVEENGYHIASAPFDVYVRGGLDCPPEEYMTEIYFPIAKA